MVSINYATKEVSCKIVYYGPGLSGKTTNLQYVHEKTPQQTRGKLISLATEADRTLYFDFLPINLGSINGFAAKFQLYTVPGQVYYNATRKLVLRGVDGVVFVADSQADKFDDNVESLSNLKENLEEYGFDLNELPIIIQYNKIDLPTAMDIKELDAKLNTLKWPSYTAVAVRGEGVFDTLKAVMKLVLENARSSSSKATKATVNPAAARPVSTAMSSGTTPVQAPAPSVAAQAQPAAPITQQPAPAIAASQTQSDSAGVQISPVAPPSSSPTPTPSRAPAPTTASTLGAPMLGAPPVEATQDTAPVATTSVVAPPRPKKRPAGNPEAAASIFGSSRGISRGSATGRLRKAASSALAKQPSGSVETVPGFTPSAAPKMSGQIHSNQNISDPNSPGQQAPFTGHDPLEDAPTPRKPKKKGFFSRLFGS